MIKYLGYVLISGLSLMWMQPVVAIPQDPSQYEQPPAPEEKKKFKSREEYRQYREQRKQNGEYHHHRYAAKSDWKAGTTLPEQYRYASYQVDYTQYPQLTQPTRYQQWVKVNNQYMLMNVLTNTIIKVIPE